MIRHRVSRISNEPARSLRTSLAWSPSRPFLSCDSLGVSRENSSSLSSLLFSDHCSPCLPQFSYSQKLTPSDGPLGPLLHLLKVLCGLPDSCPSSSSPAPPLLEFPVLPGPGQMGSCPPLLSLVSAPPTAGLRGRFLHLTVMVKRTLFLVLILILNNTFSTAISSFLSLINWLLFFLSPLCPLTFGP